jgi:hypothetical protein
MERAAPRRAYRRDSGMRDITSLTEITPDMLRETFPRWRLSEYSGSWWAMRGGPVKWDGPESLLLRVISARDLTALAEKLCLQEWLDCLDVDELEVVYRDTLLSGAAG